MKKNYKKWTLEEDKVLWEQVIANPKSNVKKYIEFDHTRVILLSQI